VTARQPTALIVDDDPSFRDSLQFLLESVRLEVRSFPSAQDFLDGAATDVAKRSRSEILFQHPARDA